jgi:hypothetical protein
VAVATGDAGIACHAGERLLGVVLLGVVVDRQDGLRGLVRDVDEWSSVMPGGGGAKVMPSKSWLVRVLWMLTGVGTKDPSLPPLRVSL